VRVRPLEGMSGRTSRRRKEGWIEFEDKQQASKLMIRTLTVSSKFLVSRSIGGDITSAFGDATSAIVGAFSTVTNVVPSVYT